MKKILFVAVLAFASVMAYAQPRAIGGRLGAFNGVSYEHGFGDSNMLEIELGWSIDGRTDFWRTVAGERYHERWWGSTVQTAVTYDWIDPFGAKFPEMPKGEWHWYMGVGGAVAAPFQFNGFSIGAAGRFGIEYDFWFPLQLSIDLRPTLGFGLFPEGEGGKPRPGVSTDIYSALGFAVRYKF